LERDKKFAEEEKQELEIQFKKVTGEPKKVADTLVQNLHKERGLASQKKKEVELKRREMEKIIQGTSSPVLHTWTNTKASIHVL